MAAPTDRTIVILAGARTPFGKFGGALEDLSATDLGVVAAQAAIKRSQVRAENIDHVIFGNALQTSADAIYLARHIGLRAAIPQSTPALTLNRLCGSGFQSIITAAQMLLLGEAQFVLAGGTESMSQAPHVIRNARWGIALGEEARIEDSLWSALTDSYCDFSMARTAEKLAAKYGVARKEADEFAYQSSLIEVNEAFAAQYLAVEREVGLNRERVNVNGGAIALGHPLGATGARITITLMRELIRRRARFGMGSACIGGGQGIALLIENLEQAV